MNRLFLTMLILFNLVVLSAMVVETGSFRGFLYGREPACQYDNWISHLAERIVEPGYNVYSPWDRQTTGFGGFNIPNLLQLVSWSEIIDHFVLQNWTSVDSLISQNNFPYQLVQFIDTETNRTYYLLREIPNNMIDDNGTPETYDDEYGAFEWGWGLYVYNPGGDQRTIITIPHPCDDYTSPVIGFEAFKIWNAQYLMINGAGREVAWTNVGGYANSKSLSDPTRVNNHPWYPAYTKFCTKIRQDTGKREFSAQFHSYDTNLHTGFASVQISAGYNKMCPNLPIRDLSRFRHDLINQANYLMLPANTIGSNSDVYVNDYYTVQYNIHPFTYSNDNITINVNNYLDLPAYSQNVQMNYTLNGWTDYDVFEPFFHVEMDELPDCYAQNDNNYKWFYGWNAHTQLWDMNNLFTRALQYYSIGIQDMSIVLTSTLNMNDNQSPLPPTNLIVYNQSYNYISLQWLKADDYDFDTYEILYATEPIGATNFSIFSRTNNSYLASPHCEQISITGLNNSTQYYFKVRAKDKNGNYSELSNEVTGYTIPVNITNFRGIGLDRQIKVKWGVANQTNNQGFRIYRQTGNNDYILVDSYLNNTALAGGSSNYTWTDVNVVNGLSYTYKLSCVSTNNNEYFHNITSTSYPRAYYTLYVSKEDGTLTDSLTFSVNPNASSGNDSDYDLVKANAPNSNYVYGAFWEQYWGNNGTYLQQEVKDDFDYNTQVKTWAIRVRSDHLDTPLIFRVGDNYARYSEKLYLRDNSTGAMTDLASSVYSFTVPNTNNRSFTLYWGNLQPIVNVSSIPNMIFQGGTIQSFTWSAGFSFLVDHYNLSIQNDTDSLFVAENLSNTYTSFSFTFPSSVDMPNARFVLDTWSTDGQLDRKISSYIFRIVPQVTFIMPDPSLMMYSNIWPSSNFTVAGLFGSDAVGWTMSEGGAWITSDEFQFGKGYWIKKNSIFDYTTSSLMQRDSLSFQLRTGWNIIPNPHYCEYQIKDIKFRINNIYFSLAEMIDQMLISRGFYVYRNGQYLKTDIIYPLESFLFKFYGPPQMNAFVNFRPYNSGTNIQLMQPYWKIKLSAQQPDSDMDALEIGAHPFSSDNYDFNFDLPEPPVKPIPGLLRLYSFRPHADTLFWDHTLDSEFKTNFGIPEEEKIWNFRLEIPSAAPVQFTVDSSLFPVDYGAAVHIGEFEHDIQHGNVFIYNPPSPGIVYGQLVIHNYFTSNQNTVLPEISKIAVFPNPFRDDANIRITLNKASRVQANIYNIKGQKITTLNNGLLKSGKNQFTWNCRDDNNNRVGSGIYLLKVKTGNKAQTIKMMLIK